MIVRVEYDRSNRQVYVCIRIGDRSSHAVAHRRVGSSLTLVRQNTSPVLPSLPPLFLFPSPTPLVPFSFFHFPLPFPFHPSSLIVPLEVGPAEIEFSAF